MAKSGRVVAIPQEREQPDLDEIVLAILATVDPPTPPRKPQPPAGGSA